MSDTSRRIARNTMALYIRTIVMLLINLYTSRVVLATLGVTDFAIYSLVGQFIMTFSIVTSTLAIATQRYITVETGKPNGNVPLVFSTSVNLHALAACAIIFLSECIGFWYIHNKLNIPPERTTATLWLFQCSLISLLLQFISIPYTAVIIAYEHIASFAYIAIGESVLKLVAVFLLPILTGDSLIIYALLSVCIATIIRIVYSLYCRHRFPNISYQAIIDVPTFRSMFKFMGWNIFGNSANVASHQLIDLLLNSFFVLTVNAARGIAGQVENAVTNFCRNVPMALNPSITKAYVTQDYGYMISLVSRGAKFCFFLFLLPSIPLIFETPLILQLWLGQFPEHTVSFVRLTLINCLIISLGYTAETTIFASGRIMTYQIMTGFLQLLIYPATWYAFRMGYPPEACYIVSITINILLLAVKLVIAHRMVWQHFFTQFFRQVIIRVILVGTLSSGISFFLLAILRHTTLDWQAELFLFCFASMLFTAIIILWGGTTQAERSFAISKIHGNFLHS